MRGGTLVGSTLVGGTLGGGALVDGTLVGGTLVGGTLVGGFLFGGLVTVLVGDVGDRNVLAIGSDVLVAALDDQTLLLCVILVLAGLLP